jgi:hypothetical protein
MEQLLLRVEDGDTALIDQAARRGGVSRAAWLRTVVRQAAYRHLAFKPLPPLVLDRDAETAIITGDV